MESKVEWIIYFNLIMIIALVGFNIYLVGKIDKLTTVEHKQNQAILYNSDAIIRTVENMRSIVDMLEEK